jgi:hypothetical protein
MLQPKDSLDIDRTRVVIQVVARYGVTYPVGCYH